MTKEKKPRKPNAKWNSKNEMSLLRLVLKTNPFSEVHGKKNGAWKDISDRLRIPGGANGGSCKAKLAALIKTYKDALNNPAKQSAVIEKVDEDDDVMHCKEKLIADVIKMQEDKKYPLKPNKKISSETSQNDLKDKVETTLGKNQLSTSVSVPDASNLKALSFEKKYNALLNEYSGFKEKQMQIDAENARARVLEAKNKASEVENNAKIHDNFAKLIAALMDQKKQ